jgi:orotate phosphoribosyltransferase
MNREKENTPLKILENLGVVVRNTHVKWKDGSHCDTFIDQSLLYEDFNQLERLCLVLTRYFIPMYHDIGIDTFLSTSVDTYHIAQLIAERYDRFSKMQPINVAFAEKDQNNKFFVNDNELSFIKNKKVLIIDDVYIVEGPNTDLVYYTRQMGGLIAGVGTILNLDSGIPLSDNINFRIIPLVGIRFKTWSSDECELCNEGQNVVGMQNSVLIA